MRSKQYFTSIKNNPHEISTDPLKCLLLTKFRYQIVTKNQPVKIVTITSRKTKCNLISKRFV